MSIFWVEFFIAVYNIPTMTTLRKEEHEGLNFDQVVVDIAKTTHDIELAKAKIKGMLYEPNGFVFFDESDETEEVIYVVAKDGDKVIGASRLKLNPTLDNEPSSALLATLLEEGFSPEQVKGKVAWFYGLALDKEYRGTGIGSKLYQEREVVAQQKGKCFFVAQSRPDSWKIYENRKYIQFGKEDVELGDGSTIERRWFCKWV